MSRHLVVFVCSLFYTLIAGAVTPQEVGQTAFVKGQVLATHPGLEQRALAKAKQGIFLQDLIKTGDASFSVLEFLDKTKVSVRPLSRFGVQEYALAELKASLALEQGGVEVQMGEIGERNPNEMLLQTPTAEVSAQQGHFRVRICGEDCAKEHKDSAAPQPLEQEVVARVTEAAGKVIALGRVKGDQGAAGQGMQRRQLALGAPLYRQDQLTTGDASRAMLLFRDGGRIGLGANAALDIKDYRWQEGGHEDHVALRLLRGGLRSMTGTLGQTAPKAFSIETPVSLVGIRGTVFDLLLEEPQGSGQPALYSYVHQGAVELAGATGPLVLQQAQGNRLQQGTSEPIAALPGDEAAIGSDPQQAQMDLEGDFGRQSLVGAPSGLYVYAVDGHVRIKGRLGPGKGRMLHLGRGEAAYVDAQGALVRLDRPRDFQLNNDFKQASQMPALPLAPVVAMPPPPPPPPVRPLVKQPPPLPPPPVKQVKRPAPKPQGCPQGSTWSKRQGTCVTRVATCPKGTFYSKRHGGCIRSEQKQDSGGTSTAAKVAVGAAIAIGIMSILSGSKGHKSHSSGCCGR